MPVSLNTITYPGTLVSENTAGLIPVALADFSVCYMLGSASSGSSLEPTQVISTDDFSNQFPDSPSLNSVRLFFNNIPNGVLYFVKVAGDNTPSAAEFVDAIEDSFDPELPQGFLIAPEAFQNLTLQSDRTSVAIAMENLCATEGYDWMALVDSGTHNVVDAYGNTAGLIDQPSEAQTEGQLYTTARGHLAYFFPYLIDLNDNVVPPSAAVAGIALRRYREQGFNQPPAGSKYPVRGVKDVAVKVTQAHQATLNPLGINAVRNLPNQGVVVWGSRTRSASPYYRFVNTRVIMNVLNGTLRSAFDSEIFSAVDGQGVLFTRIRETAAAVCYRLWDGGALFGASPAEAFAVVCDRTNNPAIDLEAGIVRCEVYAATVPTLERLLMGTYRVAIGQVQVVAGNL